MNNTLHPQNESNFDIYVAISTQNQIVNYIPIKFFNIKGENILYITVNKNIRNFFDNEIWDKNFFEVLNMEGFQESKIQLLKIDGKKYLNTREFTNELKRKNFPKDKRILWNITGGQRHILIAIFKFLKEEERINDTICYIEGNNNKILLYDYELNLRKEENIYSEKDEEHSEKDKNDYKLKDFSLVKALKLMGFDVSKTEKEKTKKLKEAINFYKETNLEEIRNIITSNEPNINNMLEEKIKEKTEENISFIKEFLVENLLYEELIKIYIKDQDLRKHLIELNKNDVDKNEIINKICTKLEENELDNFLKIYFCKYLKENINKKIFGYILEKLVAFSILFDKELMKKILDIHFSLKITQEDSSGLIDEFDIILLSKTGRVIVFECKSGSMEGDVAKSTRYSTYAISGVYGLPILITPLLKDEIENLNSLDEDLYKYIKKAIKSAKKANLKVWGLDEVKEKLRNEI